MDELDTKIQEGIKKYMANYLRNSSFTDKKITDTPTDSLSIVNRRYVTNNGSVVGRPSSSVATVGQFYLATDTNIPSWYTSGGWRNGVGSIVASA